MSESVLPHQNITHIQIDDKVIYVAGTAHVSRESVELAGQLIREIRPESVAIELDEARYQSLQDPQRWRKTDIISVIKEGRAFVLVLQIILAGFQKKLGKMLQVKPGEEMMQAAAAAEECGARLVFADRDVKITLKRTWKSIRFVTVLRLLWSSLHSLFEHKEMKKEDVERLKSPDVLNELMEELATEMPEVRGSLITERDIFLSQKIKRAPGRTVVAVVGAGHVPGIKEWIHKDVDLAPLETIPPRSLTGKITRWSVLALFILAVVYVFLSAGAGAGVHILSSWFLITGISAAIGAGLMLPHPLTVVSAFVSAPFTTFPPVLGAGWVAGLVEAWFRKPRVEDFEQIVEDASSLKGVWRNRVSRILLIMALANIGSALGAAWGAKIIVMLL